MDRRLAELGLRPAFPGGRLPKQEQPRLRQRYKELRALLDEIREAGSSRDGSDPQYQLALLIRFPLLTEDEMRAVFSERHPRRGATAKLLSRSSRNDLARLRQRSSATCSAADKSS